MDQTIKTTPNNKKNEQVANWEPNYKNNLTKKNNHLPTGGLIIKRTSNNKDKKQQLPTRGKL